MNPRRHIAMVTRALAMAAMLTGLASGAKLPAQTVTPRVAPRLAGASFVLARYTAAGSASAYGARRFGAGMAVVGVVGNPTTRYRAVILGGGTRLRIGRHDAVTVLLAGAQATDGTSLRLYVLPAVAAGRLRASATGVLKQPLGGEGRREVSMDPLTVSLPITRFLRVGLTGVLSAQQGRAVDWGVGPSVHLRALGASLSLEVVSRAQSQHLQVRGAFSATF
jgi:hypothetical protein